MTTAKSDSPNHLPFVSVIIPVYNDAERLEICLAALESQTYPKTHFEVIVVDNGSSGDMRSVVARHEQAVFAHESRAGSYAARNKGISLAKGEVLAFTDSDCIPHPEWLAGGVASLSASADIGLVGGRVVCLFKYPDRPRAFELYDYITNLDQRYWVTKEKFGITANVFTWKTMFDRVGLFNETLKSGGDMEWGKRVFAHGYQIAYADEARVSHPARYSMQQHVKKQIRVAGGAQDVKRQDPQLFKAGPARVRLPLIRRMFRVFSDAEISGIWLKTKVIGVILFLYFVKLNEIIRLRLGGRPTRS